MQDAPAEGQVRRSLALTKPFLIRLIDTVSKVNGDVGRAFKALSDKNMTMGVLNDEVEVGVQ